MRYDSKRRRPVFSKLPSPCQGSTVCTNCWHRSTPSVRSRSLSARTGRALPFADPAVVVGPSSRPNEESRAVARMPTGLAATAFLASVLPGERVGQEGDRRRGRHSREAMPAAAMCGGVGLRGGRRRGRNLASSSSPGLLSPGPSSPPSPRPPPPLLLSRRLPPPPPAPPRHPPAPHGCPGLGQLRRRARGPRGRPPPPRPRRLVPLRGRPRPSPGETPAGPRGGLWRRPSDL